MNDLEADYQRAGFGGALAFGSAPALVLVDACRAYVDPACPLYAGQSAAAALGRMAELADAARGLGLPVVFTRVEYDPEGVSGGLFFQKVPALRHFVAGHPMAQFLPDLAPQGGDIVVVKQYPSAFFGTSLASLLTAKGVNTVMLAGYSTSGCVRASALDALQHGFAPFVVADACADRAAGPHEANLFDLQAKYAEIVSAQTAIGLMRKARAG